MKILFASVAIALLGLAPLEVRAQVATKTAPVARKLVGRFQMQGGVQALALSDDGRLLAGASTYPVDPKRRRQGEIRIWEVASGRLVRSLHTQGPHTGALAFTDQTASHLWSAGGNGEDFGEAILWNVTDGKVEAKYRVADEDAFYCMAVAPDKSEVALGSFGKTFVLNARTMQLKKKLTTHDSGTVSSAAYSPDGRTLVTTEDGNSWFLRVWNPRSGQLVRSLALSANDSADHIAFIGLDAKQLLAWGWTVQIRSFPTLQKVRALEVGNDSPGTLGVSLSGNLATSTGFQEQHGPYGVRVWNLKSGQEQLKFEGHQKTVELICFSPDEQLLASADQSGRINVWNIAPLHP